MNFKERRKKLKFSIDEVADLCNVNRSTVGKWENGQIDGIRARDARKYAHALGINVADVIDPNHEFKHYSDNPYKLKKIPSIEEVERMCRRLRPKRIFNVYKFSRGQLVEQSHRQLTFNTLSQKMRHHTIRIFGTLGHDYGNKTYKDIVPSRCTDIVVYDEDTLFTGIPFDKQEIMDFYGLIPFDFDKTILVKDDLLEPLFKDKQKIFIKSSSDNLFSGCFVLVVINGNLVIRQFRATFGKIYLYPLSKRFEANSDEFLMKNEKYCQILYTIKLSSY